MSIACTAAGFEAPDASTWIVKLRPGAVFQNIAPVNGHAAEAEDIKARFTRVLDPSSANRGSLLMIDPARIETPEKQTVVFRLNYPYAPFSKLLASGLYSWILPREANAGDYDLAGKAIGSGPFTLESYSPDVAATFKRNPTWFEKGRPYHDGMKSPFHDARRPSRMTASYRADQVGSLLRPPEVLDAHAAFRDGAISLEQLRTIEDAAILTALKLQRDVGLDVFTDGEYRRGGWASDFSAAVEGYVPGPPPVTMEWRLGAGEPRPAAQPGITAQGAGAASQVVGEQLRQTRRMTGHESGFLKQHAPGPYKVTLPAASYVVARGFKPGITDRVYPTRAALLEDVVAIIRAEIRALVAEGVPYVQIDNPHYPDYVDDKKREQWSAMGIDPDQALAEDVAADNACLEGLNRDGVTLAMHLCRGNGRSAWHTSGGYDRIAEQVFGGIDVDTWLLEYDSDRAGTFAPLRLVPAGKTVVLGLVTTKEGALESQGDLLKRIDEAAKVAPDVKLALSPQCGFASVAQGNLLSWDDQRRKLELVVDTARTAWG